MQEVQKHLPSEFFASTRPVQIATSEKLQYVRDELFASTRPVQIATSSAI